MFGGFTDLNGTVMKRSVFFLMIVLVFSLSGQAQSISGKASGGEDGPPLYTPRQIREKFGVEVKEGNYMEVVGTIVDWMGQAMAGEEYSTDVILESLKEMALRLPEPARGLVYYIVADFYYNYWQVNRWQIRGRTGAPDAGGGIATWDLQRLFREALKYYNLAIGDGQALKSCLADDYCGLFYSRNIPSNKEKNTGLHSLFLPTLYDVLVYNAIQAFTGELSTVIPQQPFVIDRPEYFSDAVDFAAREIAPSAELSAEYEVLALYQQWLAFRLETLKQDSTDAHVLALLFADVERLDYLRTKGVYADADRLYEAALQRLESAWNTRPESAYVTYRRALLYETQGAYKGAYTLCREALEKWPAFSGPIGDLMEKIRRPALELVMESELSPDLPFLAQAVCRNVDRMYLRIYRVEEARTVQELRLDSFSQEKPVYECTVELLPADDFQSRTVQYRMEGLPQGRYVLFASDQPFSPEQKSLVVKSTLQVSALLGILREGDREAFGLPGKCDEHLWQFYLTGRSCGKPVSGAEVECYAYDYDTPRQSDGSYRKKLVGRATTDGEGIAYIPTAGVKNLNMLKVVSRQGDTWLKDARFYSYYYDRSDQEIRPEVTFFTDRGIYRPGQTVYYKALMTQADGEGRNHLLTQRQLTVELHDANGNEIAEQQLTTNEFGSVQGLFVIPRGLLNGTMWIKTEFGTAWIQVEEYKRPTFEVTFDTIRKNYRFEEEVEVSGLARALAGYATDQATVRYRVLRRPNYWLTRWRPGVGFERGGASREIASGEIRTDEKGAFTIRFTTLANDIKNREMVYDYVVTADVTDQNGETRGAATTVAVSNVPLLLQTSLPEVVTDRKALTFDLATTTLNGRGVPAEVELTVTSLAGPDRVLRKRLWNKADTTLIPEQEFIRDFPFDIYDREDDPQSYKPGKVVYTARIRTTANVKETRLDLGKLRRQPPGWYLVVLKARTGDGVEVENNHYIRLTGSASGKKPAPILFAEEWVTTLKNAGKPGEQALFQVAGFTRDALLRYDIFSNGRRVESRLLQVGPVPQTLSLPIREEYRESMQVEFVMVSSGRVYLHSERIRVLAKEDNLEIAFTTFRDHLLPGESEKWRLTVRNKQGEKEMAEMVATLYDASLDAFAPLYWDGVRSSVWYGESVPHWQYNTYNLLTRTQYMYRPPYSFSPFRIYRTEVIRSYRWLLNEGRAGGLKERRNILDAIKLGDPSFKLYKEKGAPPAGELEEVVVTGQYEQHKESFTGSVSVVVKGESLSKRSGDAEDAPADNADDQSDASSAHEAIATRQNFNETAFFYPQLRTDENGEIQIEFTIPEALTRWRMLGFAHTRELKTGRVEKTLVTRKLVAVSANAPRFFREGDMMEFTAKVNNLTPDALSGEAVLRLYDAATMQPLEGVLRSAPATGFEVAAGQSGGLAWRVEIPGGVSAITYRLTARAGDHTDGEERTVPVLSNLVPVTETLPFYVRAGETKEVVFERLRELAPKVRRNQSLTLEFTSNPAWYAVQAMPYLMEYPHDCSEQIFSRFYANALSAAIANRSPGVKRIFEQWRDLPGGQNALLSNLEKNQELKQLLLEETPWVVQAQKESERKKRLGLLFDLNRMAAEQRSAFEQLKSVRNGDGGFPWFPGLPGNRYITQYIVAGLGHLSRMQALDARFGEEAAALINEGFAYLDVDLALDYKKIRENPDFSPDNDLLSYIQQHYLYAASFTGYKPQDSLQREAFDFFYDQVKRHWKKNGLHGKGLTALILHRYGDTKLAAQVIASLKASARHTDDMGMFWRENRAGYFWHESPIETQALLIEAFHEVGGNVASVEEMKIWLLRNKQTNDWTTTKATAAACYALLMTGNSLLEENQPLTVGTTGTVPIVPTAAEPGTGYAKYVWDGAEITPALATLEVENPNRSGMAWGGLYWQYLEDIDRVTSAETDLGMEKGVFIKRNTPRGPELVEVKEGTPLKVGDLLTIRVILHAHRDYEYVHLKDMRASALEPVRTLSGHRYQDGLFYYENIKDAAMHFFIPFLRSGTYVFEYDLRVTHAGDFSNGITTFQCMYAPEYSAHSAGIRIRVTE